MLHWHNTYSRPNITSNKCRLLKEEKQQLLDINLNNLAAIVYDSSYTKSQLSSRLCIILFCDFLTLIYLAHALKVTATGTQPTSIILWVTNHTSKDVSNCYTLQWSDSSPKFVLCLLCSLGVPGILSICQFVYLHVLFTLQWNKQRYTMGDIIRFPGDEQNWKNKG